MSPKREQRKYARRAIPAKVQVRWSTDEGYSFSLPARCLDVSTGGMQVELERRVEPGTTVHVESGAFHLFGVARVRRCEPRGTKYLLGIEFAGGLEWKEAESG